MSISYDQKTWYNGEEGGTPITASELNRMEQGIADAVEAINEGGGGQGGGAHTNLDNIANTTTNSNTIIASQQGKSELQPRFFYVGNNHYVALSKGTTYISEDGANWTEQNNNLATILGNEDISAFSVGSGNHYVAVILTYSSRVFLCFSSNLTSWTKCYIADSDNDHRENGYEIDDDCTWFDNVSLGLPYNSGSGLTLFIPLIYNSDTTTYPPTRCIKSFSGDYWELATTTPSNFADTMRYSLYDMICNHTNNGYHYILNKGDDDTGTNPIEIWTSSGVYQADPLSFTKTSEITLVENDEYYGGNKLYVNDGVYYLQSNGGYIYYSDDLVNWNHKACNLGLLCGFNNDFALVRTNSDSLAYIKPDSDGEYAFDATIQEIVEIDGCGIIELPTLTSGYWVSTNEYVCLNVSYNAELDAKYMIDIQNNLMNVNNIRLFTATPFVNEVSLAANILGLGSGSGSGGGSGTSDYTDLTNKPSINGVELLGNKLVGLLSTDIQINAEKIGYSGTVSGASTAKAAIESLQSSLSSKGNASISAVSGTTDTFTIGNGSTSSNFYDTSGVADYVETEVDYQLYHKATFAYVTLHAWGGFQSTDRVWLRGRYEDFEGELSGADYEFTVAYCDTYSIYVGSDINSASKRGEIKVNQMGRKYEMPIFNSGYTNYATVTVKTYDQTLVGKAIEVKLSNSSQKVARFVFDEELTYTFHTNYLQEHQVIYNPTYDAQTSFIATVEPQDYGSTYMVSIATSNPKVYSRFTTSKFTGKKLMIAHRGASYECPEQSLAAYNWAGKFKFDGAECDVQFTSDNVPILMHDSTVDRTTNGSGTVASLTASQITALKIDYAQNSSGLTYYPNEKVPTLEEFLKVCKYWGMFPVIEIKEANLTGAKAQIIVNLVVKYGLLEDAIFIGSSQNNLLNLMSVDARCKCMPLIDITQANVDWCVAHNMIGIDCDYTTNLSQSKVQLCHDNGLLVGMWTIDDRTNAMTCNDYGVDMQTSDSIEFTFDCYGRPSWCDYDLSEMHGIIPTNEYERECLALGKYLKRVFSEYGTSGYDAITPPNRPRAVLCRKFNISKNIKFSFSFPTNTVITNVTLHGFYQRTDDAAESEDLGWFTTNKTSLYGVSKTYTQNVSEGIIYVGSSGTLTLTYLDLEKLYQNQTISVINEQPKITASTTDITSGSSPLTTDDLYVVYES